MLHSRDHERRRRAASSSDEDDDDFYHEPGNNAAAEAADAALAKLAEHVFRRRPLKPPPLVDEESQSSSGEESFEEPAEVYHGDESSEMFESRRENTEGEHESAAEQDPVMTADVGLKDTEQECEFTSQDVTIVMDNQEEKQREIKTGDEEDAVSVNSQEEQDRGKETVGQTADIQYETSQESPETEQDNGIKPEEENEKQQEKHESATVLENQKEPEQETETSQHEAAASQEEIEKEPKSVQQKADDERNPETVQQEAAALVNNLPNIQPDATSVDQESSPEGNSDGEGSGESGPEFSEPPIPEGPKFRFYMHDDRSNDEANGSRPSPRPRSRADCEWKHDMFERHITGSSPPQSHQRRPDARRQRWVPKGSQQQRPGQQNAAAQDQRSPPPNIVARKQRPSPQGVGAQNQRPPSRNFVARKPQQGFDTQNERPPQQSFDARNERPAPQQNLDGRDQATQEHTVIRDQLPLPQSVVESVQEWPGSSATAEWRPTGYIPRTDGTKTQEPGKRWVPKQEVAVHEAEPEAPMFNSSWGAPESVAAAPSKTDADAGTTATTTKRKAMNPDAVEFQLPSVGMEGGTEMYDETSADLYSNNVMDPSTYWMYNGEMMMGQHPAAAPVFDYGYAAAAAPDLYPPTSAVYYVTDPYDGISTLSPDETTLAQAQSMSSCRDSDITTTLTE